MHSFSLIVIALAPLGVLSQRVSTDASCGGSKGYTCLGSTFGSCCSQYGWCGSTKNYCGVGCNPSFGKCTSSASSSRMSSTARTSSIARPSSTPPASAQLVSTNARCGPSFGGRTCLGSSFGNCCSQYSYCGNTAAYCEAKTCQKGYGKCNTVSSSVLSSTRTQTSSSLVVSTSTLSSVEPSAVLSSSIGLTSSTVDALVSTPSSSASLVSSSQAAASLPSEVLSSTTLPAANVAVTPSSTLVLSTVQTTSSQARSSPLSPLSSSPTAQSASLISGTLSSSSIEAMSSTSQNIFPSPSPSPLPSRSLSSSFDLSVLTMPQVVSSSVLTAADVIVSSLLTTSSTPSLTVSSSISQTASSSTPDAVVSSGTEANTPSVFQQTSTSGSEPALVTSMPLTETPTFTSTAPEFSPSDESAFLATHTFDDSALPTPVEMGTPPITSGIEKSPPNLVKTCLVVPSKPENRFTLSDGKDKIPIVKRADGSLGAIQAPANQANFRDIDDIILTSYSFVAGSNGLFDIMTKDTPHQYIARKADGSVILTDRSTGASDPQLATTIFDVTCNGRVTVRIGSQHYSWALTGNSLVMAAADGTPETMYTIPDGTLPAQRRRNAWQQGAAPRCDLDPQPLEARIAPGARQTHPDLCGADTLNVLDPNFASCCSQLSIDYDDCSVTFEAANHKFYGCMSSICTTSSSYLTFDLYIGCKQSARFNLASATGYVGAVAFYQANSERCKCYCGSPTPDACMVNNSLQCLDVIGTDTNNCGACGRKCPAGSRCVGGTCKCPVDQCGDRCVTLASHPQNCGQCGRVSPSGICVNGQPWNPFTCSRGEGFTNGGFASGTAGWETTTSGATARLQIYTDSTAQDADKKTAMVAFNPGNNVGMKLNSQIRMCPNAAYALKFQVRRPAGTGVCYYGVYVAGALKASGQLPSPTQGGVAWQWITANVGQYPAVSREGITYKLPDLFATFVLDLICSGNAINYVIVDQFSLLPGTVAVSSVASSSVRTSSVRATSTTSAVATPSSVPSCTPGQGFTGGHFNQGLNGWVGSGTGSRLFISMDPSAEDGDQLAGTFGVADSARFSTTALLCPNVGYQWEFQIKRSAGTGTCSYVVWVGADVRRYGPLPAYNQGGGTFSWINGVAPGFAAGMSGVTPQANGKLTVDFWIDFTCTGGAPGSSDGLNYMLFDQFSIVPS